MTYIKKNALYKTQHIFFLPVVVVVVVEFFGDKKATLVRNGVLLTYCTEGGPFVVSTEDLQNFSTVSCGYLFKLFLAFMKISVDI